MSTEKRYVPKQCRCHFEALGKVAFITGRKDMADPVVFLTLKQISPFLHFSLSYVVNVGRNKM